MSHQEATRNISTGPGDPDMKRICLLRRRLPDEEHVLLRALSYLPSCLSAGAWIVDVQGLNQEVMRVDGFVELRESLLAAQLVAEEPPQSGRYRATPLGRCVAMNEMVNLYAGGSGSLEP